MNFLFGAVNLAVVVVAPRIYVRSTIAHLEPPAVPVVTFQDIDTVATRRNYKCVLVSYPNRETLFIRKLRQRKHFVSWVLSLNAKAPIIIVAHNSELAEILVGNLLLNTMVDFRCDFIKFKL
jgi:hypothetical protein